MQRGHGDPNHNLEQVQAHIRNAFASQRLPHSSTPLAKEAEALRVESPERAVAFLFGVMPNLNQYRFESQNPEAWHAYLVGLFRAHGMPGNLELDAQREAIEELHKKGERLLAERRAEYDALQTDLTGAVQVANEQADERAKAHADFVRDSKKEHADLVQKHSEEMENIRKSYQAAMALRAPVEYWTKRQTHHRNRARVLSGLVVVALLCLGAIIFATAHWAISGSVDSTKPDAWRLVLVGVVAVLGVWLVRIMVRMFLSDLHLTTDAAERVTMVQTYLSLVEGGKLTQDEERKLVLQPLFRPGADGMVKDEGPPHPAFEYFTRAGR
jgi:hypothetical protein